MRSVKVSEKIYQPEEVGADFFETMSSVFWYGVGLVALAAVLPAVF